LHFTYHEGFELGLSFSVALLDSLACGSELRRRRVAVTLGARVALESPLLESGNNTTVRYVCRACVFDDEACWTRVDLRAPSTPELVLVSEAEPAAQGE